MGAYPGVGAGSPTPHRYKLALICCTLLSTLYSISIFYFLYLDLCTSVLFTSFYVLKILLSLCCIHSTLLCLACNSLSVTYVYHVLFSMICFLCCTLLDSVQPSIQYLALNSVPCSLPCTFCSLSCIALWAETCSFLYTLLSALYLAPCPVSFSLLCILLSVKYTYLLFAP